MSFARGPVVLVAFPNSDLTTYEKSPALVVQSELADTGLLQLVVALITSNLSRTGETRVRVDRDFAAGKQMRVFVDIAIVCDVVQTVAHQAIPSVLGSCPDMFEVDSALRMVLRLGSCELQAQGRVRGRLPQLRLIGTIPHNTRWTRNYQRHHGAIRIPAVLGVRDTTQPIHYAEQRKSFNGNKP